MTTKVFLDDNEQHALIDRTLRKIDRNTWGPQPKRWRTQRFSKSRANGLAALNPWAGEKWAACVLRALKTAAASDEISFVTLIHTDWEYPSDGIDVPFVADLKQDMKRKLVGTNLSSFLMFVDVTFVRMSAGHQQICFHLHGLAWGNPKAVGKAIGAWPCGSTGAPGKTTKRIHDVGGLLNYCAKDTRTRTVVKRSGGANWHHKERLWSPQIKTLLNLLGDASKPEMTFAAGRGAKVLKLAKQLARVDGWKGRGKLA
jgi:hypothetical protein